MEWYDTECQWYNLEENSTEKEEKVNIRVTIEQPTSIWLSSSLLESLLFSSSVNRYYNYYLNII